MAPPFSGIETPFPVQARGKVYYANCVWDAYGVAAALYEDAVVEGSDGELTLNRFGDRLGPQR